MRKGKIIVAVITSACTLLGLNSCAKYEDGPSFSFLSAKNRVTNSWKVKECTTSDGLDCYEQFEEYEDHILRETGEWIIQYYEGHVVGGGEWSLNSDGTKIFYTNPDRGDLEFSYLITRLLKREMHVVDESGRSIVFIPVTN